MQKDYNDVIQFSHVKSCFVKIQPFIRFCTQFLLRRFASTRLKNTLLFCGSFSARYFCRMYLSIVAVFEYESSTIMSNIRPKIMFYMHFLRKSSHTTSLPFQFVVSLIGRYFMGTAMILILGAYVIHAFSKHLMSNLLNVITLSHSVKYVNMWRDNTKLNLDSWSISTGWVLMYGMFWHRNVLLSCIIADNFIWDSIRMIKYKVLDVFLYYHDIYDNLSTMF